MKAVIFNHYGPPEVLHIADIEKPSPDDRQVLVQVCATSINPADWHMRRNEARLVGGGLIRPNHPVPPADFAGRVEAVGSAVTQFHPGDEVFGRKVHGGLAEYLCARETSIALKPANISFEQAAAVPVAGVTALQSIRDAGQVQPGHAVVINGATGGVGTFSVQIARAFGADVTGVCGGKNLDLVRYLGANRVIDYAGEDFTRSGLRYDRIIDNVGNHPAVSYARVLKSGGICVGVGFTSIPLLIQFFIFGRIISRFGNKKMVNMLARIVQKDLAVLKEMIEAGKVIPVIDRCYPLSEVVEAFRYAETRHARGKVVIKF